MPFLDEGLEEDLEEGAGEITRQPSESLLRRSAMSFAERVLGLAPIFFVEAMVTISLSI